MKSNAQAIQMRKKMTVKDFLVRYNAIIILIALIVISACLSPVFLTAQNIFNILRQNTPIFLISMGMLMVILTGGIDLSVGSIAAVGGMLITVALVDWMWITPVGLIIAILFTLAVCTLLGAVSGALVTFFRMAPFVVTLAMMTIARGIAYLITNGQPIRWPSEGQGTDFMLDFASKGISVVPWPVIFGVVVFVIFLLIQKKTVFGRLVVATGSNENAVVLAGINAKKYKFAVYAISGLMCGLAGIIMTSRSGTGAPVSGDGYELDAIAACVIGGASLNGGKGKVGNTLIGVLILGLITNIMNLLSVPAYPQQIVKGIIIIASVLIQSVSNRSQDA